MSGKVVKMWQKIFRQRPSAATVALNMRPAKGPWGGSSLFVEQCEAILRRRGYRVSYSLAHRPDLVIIIDPRDDLQNKTFGMEELRQYKQANPRVKVLHRVNECDQRKGTTFMDKLLRQANTLADHTVFISAWLREYFVDRWFDTSLSHSVIYNGADPAIFHPVGTSIWRKDQPIRLVTHHWSDNPMKGFPLYRQLDAAIASGELPDVEFWVVGRWPADIVWKAVRTFPPRYGKPLADLLRQCHGYITASLWEPCGMHHVEGAQCGLPLLYHRDGGGINEAGQRYGLEFDEMSLNEVVKRFRSEYEQLRYDLLRAIPSGDAMAIAYANVIQEMLCR